MNAYERHIKYTNDCVNFYGGASRSHKVLEVKPINDFDVLEKEHKFVWEEWFKSIPSIFFIDE